MFSLALAGDVMLGRGVNDFLREVDDPAEPWGDVLPELLHSTARIVNLECAITSHTERWRRHPKVFYFRGDPRAAASLAAAGIDAVSLANNHAMDFGEPGLFDTFVHLRSAQVRWAGAGGNIGEARAPAVVGPPEFRVGLVACTDNEPGFSATRCRPGTQYLPVSLDKPVLRRVELLIQAAHDGGARWVVFSNHWGPNMRTRPPVLFQRFAHAVMDRGADVYFGHSAHVFQGVELYRGRPILYDTGDFLDDYVVDELLRNDWSFLFRLYFDESRFAGLELLPVKLTLAHVNRATGLERESILARMVHFSRELGTYLRPWRGRLLAGGTDREEERELWP